MFKTTLACVVVNMIVAHSCIAASYPTVPPDPNIQLFSNTTTNSILKQYKDAESNVEFLLLGFYKFLSRECNDKQGIFSSYLKHSMKPMLERFIENAETRLTKIRIPQMPGAYYKIDNDAEYLEFQLTEFYLQHLDLSISKLEYDVCKLSSEIDITLPQVEISAAFTLIGQIDDFPITGDGVLLLNVDSVNYYQKSYINNCQSDIFTGKDCNLANMNVTTDVGVQQFKVTVSGVQYRNLSTDEVNQKLNNYISEYFKANKMELKQRLADMIYMYMMDIRDSMTYLDPLKIYTKMKEVMKKVLGLIF